jgi:hypothetical protein
MAALNRSRPFEALPATPRSLPHELRNETGASSVKDVRSRHPFALPTQLTILISAAILLFLRFLLDLFFEHSGNGIAVMPGKLGNLGVIPALLLEVINGGSFHKVQHPFCLHSEIF